MRFLSRVFPGSPSPIPLKEAEAPKESRSTTGSVKSVLEQRSIDEARPLRVVVIGAGISGILACIRFVQRIPNLEICIYDKNADIGGTWFENRYPGCACGRRYPDKATLQRILLTPVNVKISQHTLTKQPSSQTKNGPSSMRVPLRFIGIGNGLWISTDA